MELVATAQFKKAMEKAVAADAYSRWLVALVHDLTEHEMVDNPLVTESKKDPAQKKAILLTLSANRGMCGGFNAGVMRLASHRLQDLRKEFGAVSLEVSGKRGISAFKFRGISIDQTYTDLQDKPALESINDLADHFIKLFLTREIGRLDICYVKFDSISRQYPVVETLLPMAELTKSGDVNAIQAAVNVDYKAAAMVRKADDAIADGKDIGVAQFKMRDRNTLYEFLPSLESIVEELIPKAFKAKLFKCFLDSAVNEQIARMVAMKSATESADKMISLLTTAYNRARQSQITNEILEIISGADALAN